MKIRDDRFEEQGSSTRDLHDPGTPAESAVMAIRRGTFAVMRLLRPLVSLGSLLLVMVCGVLLVFSLTFPPGTHFPGGLIVGIALSCVGINYAYGYLMSLVLPSGTVGPH